MPKFTIKTEAVVTVEINAETQQEAAEMVRSLEGSVSGLCVYSVDTDEGPVTLPIKAVFQPA